MTTMHTEHPFPLPRLKEAIKDKYGTLKAFRAVYFADAGRSDWYNTKLLGYWFNGSRRPKPSELKAMADLLDVSVDWILERTDNRHSHTHKTLEQ